MSTLRLEMSLDQLKNRRTQVALSLAVAFFLAGTMLGRFVIPVKVTNFPLDEQGNLRVTVSDDTETHRDVERIVLFESFTDGIDFERGGQTIFYDFSSKSTFINVTEIYINVVIKAEGEDDWDIDFAFGLSDNNIRLIQHVTTYAKNYEYKVSDYNLSFNYSIVQKGINSLILHRWDITDAHLFIQRLELLIEYNYVA